MTSARQALFLEAMAVGPLWLTRHAHASAPAPALSAEPAAAATHNTEPAVAAPLTQAAPIQNSLPVAVPRTRPAEPDGEAGWFDAAPMPAPVSAAALAQMDWAALKAAAASCTRCELCQGRKGVVFGRGDPAADWFILGAGPSRADEKSLTAVSGEAGKLLDNMLLARALTLPQNVYVTNLVKCRAADGAERAPTAQQVAACRPFLERELALTAARTIITLGQNAARGLLAAPPAERGVLRQLGACTVLATADPVDLLQDGLGKAAVWADLCLLTSAPARND